MTRPKSSPTVRAPSPRAVAAVGAAVLVAVAALTLGLLVTDQATVTSAADLAHVEFGEPLAWIVQGQTSLDPPSFPRRVSLLSPLEHPGEVLWARLVANLAILGTPAMAAATVALRRTRSRG